MGASVKSGKRVVRDSFVIAEYLCQQRLAIEEPEVFSNGVEVECGSIGANQRTDILKILGAARIIDERLELESDQPFGAYNPQIAKQRLMFRSLCQQLERSRAAGV